MNQTNRGLDDLVDQDQQTVNISGNSTEDKDDNRVYIFIADDGNDGGRVPVYLYMVENPPQNNMMANHHHSLTLE